MPMIRNPCADQWKEGRCRYRRSREFRCHILSQYFPFPRAPPFRRLGGDRIGVERPSLPAVPRPPSLPSGARRRRPPPRSPSLLRSLPPSPPPHPSTSSSTPAALQWHAAAGGRIRALAGSGAGRRPTHISAMAGARCLATAAGGRIWALGPRIRRRRPTTDSGGGQRLC